MKIKTHVILLLLPLALWSGWLGSLKYQQGSVDPYFSDPDKLTWETEGGLLTSNVKKTLVDEYQVYIVQLILQNGTILYENRFEIDWDIGGAGFLLAMQADSDPEMEIVVYRRGFDYNPYIDVENGQLVEKDFKLASRKAQSQAQKWLKAYAPNPFMVGLCVVITGSYCLLYVLLVVVSQWKRRKTKQKGSSKDF